MKRTGIGIGSGLAAGLAFALAGCAAIPAATPPPAAAPEPAAPPTAAPPPPAKPWDERALDAGAWRYDRASRTAAFVATGSASPLVTMACSGDSIRLSAGLGGAGAPLDVALQTTAGTDQLRFQNGSATLSARDGRLDKIAFSRGRFALEASNGSRLTLPVQSEIGRVIEDCRG